jgi:hypothetical protein
VNFESRLGVSCGLRIFEAATLVNCNVNQDAARFHLANHFVGNQLWRFRTWNKHRANHEIGFVHRSLQLKSVAHDCAQATCIEIIEFTKAIQVCVEHGNFSSHADSDRNCVSSGNSGTNNGYSSWASARHTAHEHSVAAVLAHKGLCANQWCKSTGNLAHRCQEWQRARRQLNSFIGDRGHLAREQHLGKWSICC